MNRPRHLGSFVLAAALLTAVIAFGCSKSSSPTNPGGGGGGTNPSFDSGLRSTGFSMAETFPAAGSVAYHCTPHASLGMTASITVSSSSSVDSALVTVAPGGSLTFDPASVTIRTGGTVRWVWGASGHTVTSGAPAVAQR